MYVPLLNSGLDTFFVAVPFLALLVAGLFRLDALFTAPRQREVPRQPTIGIDESGRRFLCDPDGHTHGIFHAIAGDWKGSRSPVCGGLRLAQAALSRPRSPEFIF